VTSALVVVALPQEAAHLRQRDVLVTGVGQAAAAAALAKRLAEGPLPGVVVNVGTAGSLDATYSAVLEIGYVTRHDFPYDAIAELAGADAVVRGYRLRSDRPPLPASSPPPGEVALATGDAFVNDAARAEEIAAAGVHLVDMEAFALAAVCARFGLPMRCVKAVSDSADTGAVRSWLDTVDGCARDLAGWLEQAGWQ